MKRFVNVKIMNIIVVESVFWFVIFRVLFIDLVGCFDVNGVIFDIYLDIVNFKYFLL